MIIKFIVIIVINKLASIYANKNAEKLLENPYKPLPDILHSRYKFNIHLPDYILLSLFVFLFINYVMNNTLVEISDFHKNIDILFIVLLLRPIFVISTILPTCMPKPKKNENLYQSLFLSTHDLMFSGHTCIFQFIGTIIGGYIGIIIKYILPFVLVISRQHYTIDVLVSIIVYGFIYLNYQ